VSCTLVTYVKFNRYAIPFESYIGSTESITELGVLVVGELIEIKTFLMVNRPKY